MSKVTKYRTILFVLLLSCFDQSLSAENACADWASYKDEKCFKVIDDTLKTYDEAEKACAKLENTPTLAIIHSQEEQDFLANYLFKTLKKVDNFWIGAKCPSSSSFKWVDNSEMNYANWVKTPKNTTNYCVQMQSEVELVGKWTEEPCEKRNAVVCQKMQTWSMARLQKSHLDARKEFRDLLDEQKQKLDEANQQITNLKQMLENEKNLHNKNISDLKQNLIPVGFLYTQLPNEKSPELIWPSMRWSDVSSSYAGVFFRVEGGGSEPFGQTQVENDRRVVQVNMDAKSGGYQNVTIDATLAGQNTKKSEEIWTGDYVRERKDFMVVRLVTTTGEIRPRNMAIRVWKRIG